MVIFHPSSFEAVEPLAHVEYAHPGKPAAPSPLQVDVTVLTPLQRDVYEAFSNMDVALTQFQVVELSKRGQSADSVVNYFFGTPDLLERLKAQEREQLARADGPLGRAAAHVIDVPDPVPVPVPVPAVALTEYQRQILQSLTDFGFADISPHAIRRLSDQFAGNLDGAINFFLERGGVEGLD
jgi:hypothetical protein